VLRQVAISTSAIATIFIAIWGKCVTQDAQSIGPTQETLTEMIAIRILNWHETCILLKHVSACNEQCEWSTEADGQVLAKPTPVLIKTSSPEENHKLLRSFEGVHQA